MGINKVRKKKKKHGHTRDTLDVDQGLPYTERTSKSNGHCVGKKKLVKISVRRTIYHLEISIAQKRLQINWITVPFI